MTSNTIRIASMMASTLSTGLGAGVYAVFSHTIMPGLATTDDRTFVTTFQAIDRHIVNPWFIGGSFLGSLVLTGVSAAVSRGHSGQWLMVAASAASLATIIITVAVHLPLNDAIRNAGDPMRIDVANVRAAFHATRWQTWNLLRVFTSIGAFATSSWALVLSGRAAA